ncbi:MAG: hypothetical protein N2645_08305 [Clostridia bacterium]|nr:hypothetical protein [Clostridia bacterium]
MSVISFFDDLYIDQTFKMTRTLHYPEKCASNPVIKPTESWEGTFSMYGSVILDEGVYKAYYTMWWLNKEPPYDCINEGIALALSRDGVNWEKPCLNVVNEINNGNNNLIFLGKYADQPCVVKLEKPVNENRYAMAYYADLGESGPGIRLCFSTDGIHWNWPGDLIWQTPIDAVQNTIEFFAADDTINFCFDASSKKYVLLRKVMQDFDLVYDPKKHGNWKPVEDETQRMIAQCDSKDLGVWENHRIILKPDMEDPLDIDFHRFGYTVYENQYMGLLEKHDANPLKRNTEIDLVVSRDGETWTRPKRGSQPFIKNGDKGDWDHGVLFVTPQMIQKYDEVLIYYGGMESSLAADQLAGCENFGIGLAKIGMDRFLSLRSSENIGFVRTKPLEVKNGIAVNAVVNEDGFLKAAVLDEKGMEIEGFGWKDCDPLIGDMKSMEVTWRGKPFDRKGRFSLNIASKASDLFAVYLL